MKKGILKAISVCAGICLISAGLVACGGNKTSGTSATTTPSATPTATAKPSATPAATAKPSTAPSATPAATAKPSTAPSATPAATAKPSTAPSATPAPAAAATPTPAAATPAPAASAATGENLALAATATENNTYTKNGTADPQDKYKAIAAVDGVYSSRWATDAATSPTMEGKTEYILTLEFKEAKTFSKAIVYDFQGISTEFKIKYSDNGKDWKEVAGMKVASEPATNADLGMKNATDTKVTATFTAVTAKYVSLNVPTAIITGGGPSIYEFEVYK